VADEAGVADGFIEDVGVDVEGVDVEGVDVEGVDVEGVGVAAVDELMTHVPATTLHVKVPTTNVKIAVSRKLFDFTLTSLYLHSFFNPL
jgi:hypothetical protein